jgi:hypothetical protein
LALAIGGSALTLLVVCQVLLIGDRDARLRTKSGTGVAVLAVLLLSVEWVRVTNGQPSIQLLQRARNSYPIKR